MRKELIVQEATLIASKGEPPSTSQSSLHPQTALDECSRSPPRLLKASEAPDTTPSSRSGDIFEMEAKIAEKQKTECVRSLGREASRSPAHANGSLEQGRLNPTSPKQQKKLDRSSKSPSPSEPEANSSRTTLVSLSTER